MNDTLEQLYELMGRYPEDHGVTVIDPLGVDDIPVTAQASEDLQDHEGS